MLFGYQIPALEGEDNSEEDNDEHENPFYQADLHKDVLSIVIQQCD